MTAAMVILLVIAFVFVVGEITYRLVALSRVATPRRTQKLTGLFVIFLVEFFVLAKIIL